MQKDDRINLGSCCCCGREDKTVRNVVCLHKRSPIHGRGWGCVVCGLPSDGASYVCCDECLEKKAEPKWACRGYPGIDGRVPIDELEGVHEHDMSRH